MEIIKNKLDKMESLYTEQWKRLSEIANNGNLDLLTKQTEALKKTYAKIVTLEVLYGECVGSEVDSENANCAIFDVVRSTANIEMAIKHFERRHKEYKGKLSADEVLKTLHFLKQANEQGLDIIGIGYTRYDGGDIKECSVKNMYEGGFMVRK